MLISLGVLMLTLAVLGALAVERWRSSTVSAGDNERASPQGENVAPFPESDSKTAILSSIHTLTGVTFSRPTLVLGFALGALLVIFGQRDLNTGNPASISFLFWFAGLALLVAVEWQSAAIPLPVRALPLATWARPVVDRWRWFGILLAVVPSLYIIDAVPDRQATDASWDVVFLWLVSNAGLVLASGALPKQRFHFDPRSTIDRHATVLLLGLAIATFAGVTRFFDLSNYAWSLSGDEGTFAVTARSTLEGNLRNPFFSGPWGYPSLIFIIQGWFIDVFGATVGSARMLSAVFGVASVFAVWLLVREHFGPYPAMLAALISGSMNMHIYWSRDAQNAAAPMFFLPLALLFLDRGLVGGGRRASLAAGFTIAAGQFFHPANRLLLIMALGYLAYALLVRTWNESEVSLRAWGTTLANGGWLAAAVVVGHLPLIVHFRTYPHQFWSRTDEVSVFASGWLSREQDITGDSAVTIMVRQIWNAFLAPFSHPAHGHYRPDTPLVGWPLVIFVAFGCALATVWFLRRSYFPLSLGFWVVTVGLGFTEGPPMTNRYTTAMPVLAAFGAIGIWGFASIAIKVLRVPRLAIFAGSTLIAVFIVFWNVEFYFRDPNQVALYSDANSQMTNQLARQAEPLGTGTTVYLSGAPVLWYYGFQNLPYMAPNAVGIDVDPVWDAGQQAPQLNGPTLFAIIPDRVAELEVIRGWFPDGTEESHFLPNGQLLYVSYLVLPDS